MLSGTSKTYKEDLMNSASRRSLNSNTPNMFGNKKRMGSARSSHRSAKMIQEAIKSEREAQKLQKAQE